MGVKVLSHALSCSAGTNEVACARLSVSGGNEKTGERKTEGDPRRLPFFRSPAF